MPEVLSTAPVMVICRNSPGVGLPADGLAESPEDGLDDVLAVVARGVGSAPSGFRVHPAWKQMAMVVRINSDRVP